MYSLDFPSEKFIEDYLYAEMNGQMRCPVSGDGVDFVFRQLDLGGYGVTDIVRVGLSKESVAVTVVELKNENLKPAHLAQLCRYVTGLQSLAYKYRRAGNIVVKGELVGPVDVDNENDLVFLANQINPNILIRKISLTMSDGFVSSDIGRQWRKTSGFGNKKNMVRAIYEAFSSEYGEENA